MLPMRTLAQGGRDSALAVNRRGAISFHDVDHGDGRSAEQGGALAWLDGLLQAEGIDDATGEVWLHTYPRVLGYTFKPVSFWYCHRADGSLRAILVEVNNTFGERHCYLLDAPQYGVEQQARKVFHVSPFCEVAGGYRFRFMRTAPGPMTRAAPWCALITTTPGPLIQTSVSGTLQPATARTLRQALWATGHDAGHHRPHPLARAAAVAQARAFHRKPEAPASIVTRLTCTTRIPHPPARPLP